MVSPIRDRQANRRIRLLLALFTLVFVAMLARAFWLQGVQAAHLSALASPRIQSLAHQQDGLTQADPSTIGYIDLSR